MIGILEQPMFAQSRSQLVGSARKCLRSCFAFCMVNGRGQSWQKHATCWRRKTCIDGTNSLLSASKSLLSEKQLATAWFLPYWRPFSRIFPQICTRETLF